VKPQNFCAEKFSAQLMIIKQVKHMSEKYALLNKLALKTGPSACHNGSYYVTMHIFEMQSKYILEQFCPTSWSWSTSRLPTVPKSTV